MSTRRKKRKTWRNKLQRSTLQGTAPGTLIVDPEAPHPVIHLISYGPEKLVEAELKDAAEVKDYLGKLPVTWINVTGLGDVSVIRQLGEFFSIHRLALEDVVNTHQRAKVEEYEDKLFIVCSAVSFTDKLDTQQLSMFLGKDFLLSFQEHSSGCFDGLRDRLRKGTGHIRRGGVDYLTYALLDGVTDTYFPVLEKYGERLDVLEDAILANPNRNTMEKIHRVKRDLLIVRRAIWPFRDAINMLTRDDRDEFSRETQIHLRDCADHIVRVMEWIETEREIAADLLDMYLSSLSNRMNDIMRILAVITTVFVPPTFIVGIYGMNYADEANPMKHPALKWLYGFPVVLSMVFLVLVVTMFGVWKLGMFRSHEHAEDTDDSDGKEPDSDIIS